MIGQVAGAQLALMQNDKHAYAEVNGNLTYNQTIFTAVADGTGKLLCMEAEPEESRTVNAHCVSIVKLNTCGTIFVTRIIYPDRPTEGPLSYKQLMGVRFSRRVRLQAEGSGFESLAGYRGGRVREARSRAVNPVGEGAVPSGHPMAGYSRGQRGPAVNRLALPAQVRLLHLPLSPR